MCTCSFHQPHSHDGGAQARLYSSDKRELFLSLRKQRTSQASHVFIVSSCGIAHDFVPKVYCTVLNLRPYDTKPQCQNKENGVAEENESENVENKRKERQRQQRSNSDNDEGRRDERKRDVRVTLRQRDFSLSNYQYFLTMKLLSGNEAFVGGVGAF